MQCDNIITYGHKNEKTFSQKRNKKFAKSADDRGKAEGSFPLEAP
jgi:hypothetical protein